MVTVAPDRLALQKVLVMGGPIVPRSHVRALVLEVSHLISLRACACVMYPTMPLFSIEGSGFATAGAERAPATRTELLSSDYGPVGTGV